MKRTELIKILERNGWTLKREGGSHSIYSNGDVREAIPRHREIDENLARAIIRKRGLK
jgi:predicted RNA binding protein YcfA (HicA-like mRNA interferase family)